MFCCCLMAEVWTGSSWDGWGLSWFWWLWMTTSCGRYPQQIGVSVIPSLHRFLQGLPFWGITVVILDGNAQFKSKATPTQHMGSLEMKKRRGPSTEPRGTPQVKLTWRQQWMILVATVHILCWYSKPNHGKCVHFWSHYQCNVTIHL